MSGQVRGRVWSHRQEFQQIRSEYWSRRGFSGTSSGVTTYGYTLTGCTWNSNRIRWLLQNTGTWLHRHVALIPGWCRVECHAVDSDKYRWESFSLSLIYPYHDGGNSPGGFYRRGERPGVVAQPCGILRLSISLPNPTFTSLPSTPSPHLRYI
jgi:hypothetical protein